MSPARANSPLVTICIPTYERPKELLKALNSCFEQTYQNLEIVITDNSQTDETQRLIQSLGRANIRYSKNLVNIGPIDNLKLAIDSASGEYIKVLMDDDILLPTAIEKMASVLEDFPQVGVVMAPMFIIDDCDRRIDYRAYLIKKLPLIYRYRKESGLIPGKRILYDFLTTQYPCCVPSGIMYRKTCFDTMGPIDIDMKFAVDVDICARFSAMYDFYYIDEPLSAWRYSELSHTVVNLHKKGQDTEIYYRLTEKLLRDQRIRDQFSDKEYAKLRKNAYFFSSKRAVLSIIAGLRSRNLALIFQTIKLMKKNDPYPSNLMLLPFNIAGEVFKAGISWI